VPHPHPASPSRRKGRRIPYQAVGTQGVRPATGARCRRAEELRAYALGYDLSHLRRYGAPRAFGKVWRRHRGELDRGVGEAECYGVCMGLKLHSSSGLRGRGQPRARACPSGSAAGGDQNGLNLRAALWSNIAANRLRGGRTPAPTATPESHDWTIPRTDPVSVFRSRVEFGH